MVDRNHTHILVRRLDKRVGCTAANGCGRNRVEREETGRFRRRGGTSVAAKPSHRRGIRIVCLYPVYVMSEWKTPAGVCGSSWRGWKCERIPCKYDHGKRHSSVPPPPPGAPPAQISALTAAPTLAATRAATRAAIASQTSPPPTPRHPSRASVATTGTEATQQEATEPEGTDLVLRRGRERQGWGR